MPEPIQVPAMPRASLRTAARAALSLLAVLAGLAALLFLPAGRLDWPEAWGFLAAYGVFLALYALWGLLKDPGQLAERSHAGPNVKRWDRILMGAYSLLLLVTFVVAGFDAGRFRWSSVALPVKAVAWLGLAAAGALIFWTLASNTYLSRMARIQDDRGQVVVSTGPYCHVRHPMYLGIIILFLCAPLALGAWWALIPGALVGVLFVVRTSREDHMLHEELAGYADYAGRVRYRLMPGVW